MRTLLTLFLSSIMCSGAVKFNGTSDYIDFGDINSLDGASQLTVMFWVKALAINSYGSLINKSDSGPLNGWGVSRYSTETNFMVFMSNSSVSSVGVGATTDNSFTTNVWHHVAMVYDGTLTGDGNRLKLFIDGTQRTLNFIASPVPATGGASTNNLAYGAADAPSYALFSTIILDDVVIATRVLSTYEMERHRLGKIRLTVFNNQEYTPLDNIPLGQSCNGLIMIDRSNNNRHGSANGGTSIEGVGFSYP